MFVAPGLKELSQGPFNKKENAFVVIMASAAANSALGTEILAVQRLASITYRVDKIHWYIRKGYTTISRPIPLLQFSCSSLLNCLGTSYYGDYFWRIAHEVIRYGIGGMMRSMHVSQSVVK